MKNVIVPNNITIGSHTFIGDNTRLESIKSIGKYCSISHDVVIGLGSHPKNFLSTSPVFYSTGRGYVQSDIYNNAKEDGITIIENDVLISSNVLILAGVKVGTGAIVGAGSVVTRDIPPYSIVAGIPARIINYRFDETTIEKLLSSKWWEKDIDKIIENRKFIDKPLELVERL